MGDADEGRRLVLVLDFDGTVCLGEGPLRAYAGHIAALLDGRRAALLADELDAYLGGLRPHSDYGDGYALVADLGAGLLPAEQARSCYRASRRWLAQHPEEVSAPAGLDELLDRFAGRVHRVLVSNSPRDSVLGTLRDLGLAERFDEVRGGAGKPAGFPLVLDELAATDPGWACLSAGDFWANDIEPALHAGWTTCWLNPVGLDPRPCHLTGPDMASVTTDLLAWADRPREFASRHRPTS